MSLEENVRKTTEFMNEADRKAEEADDPLLRLRQISGTHQIDKMRQVLTESTYVIPGMVISGSIAQFYAKPNGGKTLFIMHSLIEQIKAGNLKGDDVFYVNEDDNFSGFLYKCELADKYGFSMISTSRSEDENLRDPAAILDLIIASARSGNLSGMVFIFDTLKKFCSVMDKAMLAGFFRALRVITAHGGTVILLGHANKHLDNGKLIYEGVSDIQGDIDIQYAIYNLSDRTDARQIIRFDNEKDRGEIDMVRTMEYRKEQGMNYESMLNSLRVADDQRVDEIDRDLIRREIHERYEFEVPYILEHIRPGMSVKKTEFVAQWQQDKPRAGTSLEVRSRNKLADALDALIGYDLTMKPGDRGAKLISLAGTMAQRYQQAKDGE